MERASNGRSPTRVRGREKESAAPPFVLVRGWPRPCANSRRLDVRLRPDWSVEQGQLAVESVLPADEALTAGDALRDECYPPIARCGWGGSVHTCAVACLCLRGESGSQTIRRVQTGSLVGGV